MSPADTLIVRIAIAGGGEISMAVPRAAVDGLGAAQGAEEKGAAVMIEGREVRVRWDNRAARREVVAGDRYLIARDAIAVARIPGWSERGAWDLVDEAAGEDAS